MTRRTKRRLVLAAVVAACSGLHGQVADVVESREVLVFLPPEVDLRGFASANGLTLVHSLQSDPNSFVFAATDAAAAAATVERLSGSEDVKAIYSNGRSANVLCSFTPNDPYYRANYPVTNAAYTGQWHLGANTNTLGIDARVTGAWSQGYTGTGVIIGICDDSFQTTHPDLSPGYVATNSRNFGSYVTSNGQSLYDPNPVWSSDRHGISVAGVAGARGGNGIGVTGAAPYAGLAGLRIDFVAQTDAMFVDATKFNSGSGVTNIRVKNHSYGISTPYVSSTAQRDALLASTALGTIHCLAAGNDRGGTNGANSNAKMIQALPDVITVAALGENGRYAYYSSYGANVMVCAPSSGVSNYGITTTDRVGTLGYNGGGGGSELAGAADATSYTDSFGGTSSATPLVSGIMALGIEANNAMTTRMAKHLLARTSRQVDVGSSTWITNGAGRKFSPDYGFGLIDADAFCRMAAQDARAVTALTLRQVALTTVSASIPDNSTNGVSRTFSFTNRGSLEEMVVSVKTSHIYGRGDLQVDLISPSGSTSTLAYTNTNTASAVGTLSWTFSSNAFWGEELYGTWTLRVADKISGNTGTWTNFSVTARSGDLATWDTQWQGAATGSWTSSTNWSWALPVAASSRVSINGMSNAVSVSGVGAQTCSQLGVGSSGTFTSTLRVVAGDSLGVSGSSTLGLRGLLSLEGGSLSLQGLSISGTAGVGGSFRQSAGIATIAGVTNQGRLDITGGTFRSTVVNSGTASLTGVLGSINGAFVSSGTGLTGALVVGNGTQVSSVSMNYVRQQSLTLNSGASLAIVPSGSNPSVVGSLLLGGSAGSWGARLDLGNNDLVVDYAGTSPMATIVDQLASARAGGTWSGNGIGSSVCGLGIPNALGVAEAGTVLSLTGTQRATWNGVSVDAGSVLVKYTYVGDATLDGTVDLDDMFALVDGFDAAQNHLPVSWALGDFDYSATVDLDDLFLLIDGMNASSAGPLATPVPEPRFAVVGCAAVLGLARRRRSLPAVAT